MNVDVAEPIAQAVAIQMEEGATRNGSAARLKRAHAARVGDGSGAEGGRDAAVEYADANRVRREGVEVRQAAGERLLRAHLESARGDGAACRRERSVVCGSEHLTRLPADGHDIL